MPLITHDTATVRSYGEATEVRRSEHGSSVWHAVDSAMWFNDARSEADLTFDEAVTQADEMNRRTARMRELHQENQRLQSLPLPAPERIPA